MLTILYEDNEIIVVEKPVGIESQSSRGFEPDMVSEIRKHINRLCTVKKEPYVGVIHRLDKPVGGIMVYAKTQKAAAVLSKQVQNGTMKKHYQAVVCGKPVDIVGNFVDFMLKQPKSNDSHVVDKSVPDAKKAELNYKVMGTIEENGNVLSLVDIELLTGRHHQIRVQFAYHGTPLWGDNRYNPDFVKQSSGLRANVALCAYRLEFAHPVTHRDMSFAIEPSGNIFHNFKNK